MLSVSIRPASLLLLAASGGDEHVSQMAMSQHGVLTAPRRRPLQMWHFNRFGIAGSGIALVLKAQC